MENLPVWTIWFAVSAVLVVMEIFTGTFFLLCFGIGAAAGAIAALAELSVLWQWAAFAAVSTLAVGLSRKVFLKVSPEPEQKAGVDRLVGKRGVVTEVIGGESGEGRVSVQEESWRAVGVGGAHIESGVKVSVVGVEGTKLLVEEWGNDN